jgi:hypothetical protein
MVQDGEEDEPSSLHPNESGADSTKAIENPCPATVNLNRVGLSPTKLSGRTSRRRRLVFSSNQEIEVFLAFRLTELPVNLSVSVARGSMNRSVSVLSV